MKLLSKKTNSQGFRNNCFKAGVSKGWPTWTMALVYDCHVYGLPVQY